MEATKSRCAQCNKPAHKRCLGCTEGLDIQGKRSPTFYCSKTCMKSHWKTHRSDCQNANHRKQLYRAGRFTQSMFYASRKAAFDLKVVKASKKDGRLYVEEGEFGENEILTDFSEGMFEDDGNTEDKNADMILAWNSCGEAMERMQKLVAKALHGAYSKLEEVKVRIPLGRCRVISKNGKKEAPTHVVFKVHLKDGISYAFDLTGAQYGRFNPVTPWSDFEKDMVAETLEHLEFGWYAKRKRQDDNYIRERQAQGKRVPLSHQDLGGIVQRTITDCMNRVVDMRLADLKMSARVNGEGEPGFEEVRDLQLLVKSSIEAFVAWLKGNGQKEILRGDPDVFNKFVAVQAGDEEAIEHHRIVEEWREKKYAEEARISEAMERLLEGYEARGATIHKF